MIKIIRTSKRIYIKKNMVKYTDTFLENFSSMGSIICSSIGRVTVLPVGGAVVGVAAVVVVVAAAVAAVSVFVALVDMPVLVLLGVTTSDVETDVVVILVVPRVRREDKEGEEENLPRACLPGYDPRWRSG